MKLAFTLAMSLATAALAQETKPAAETKAPVPLDATTLKDRVSYFYGGDVARSFRDNGVEINYESFLQGLKDTLEKGNPKFTQAELEGAMNQFAQAMMTKQQKVAGEAAASNAAAGEKFLTENGKRKEVTTTESGLQYEVMKKGDGPKPKAADTVTVHYHGTLIDGKVFDSSVQRGEPASFPVNGVIPGWVEALQLMPVGSKWKLFIPSKLAYAERGAGRDIGPNSTLIFEVELIKIGQ
jgi:FKBP-type peptidyl-prolyl cis-trans isomerase